MNSKFKMPTKSNLKSRSSTISNAFAISITPFISPTQEETAGYYEQLQIKEGQCAYCLGEGNGRDHLKPLVEGGMPTGYITDIHNLIPCCQRCNSSKGSKDFRSWYKSEKNIQRLKKYGLTEQQIDERYKIICKYENNIGAKLDYESIIGKEKWDEYKRRKEALLMQLKSDQEFCDELYEIVLDKITKK